jgi:hypothetical protein
MQKPKDFQKAISRTEFGDSQLMYAIQIGRNTIGLTLCLYYISITLLIREKIFEQLGDIQLDNLGSGGGTALRMGTVLRFTPAASGPMTATVAGSPGTTVTLTTVTSTTTTICTGSSTFASLSSLATGITTVPPTTIGFCLGPVVT